MAKGFSLALPALLFAAIASCSPVMSGAKNGTSTASSSTGGTSSSTSAAPAASPTVPYASDSLNKNLWDPTSDIKPEPIRNSIGATVLGPQNIPLDLQNPDSLAPPTTDGGNVPNLKWPFSLSHTQLQSGGWARVENTAVLPVAKDIAGADFRLEAGAIRELHWHSIAEWSYVISGYTQISAVDQYGRNYVGTAGPGDLWYFPPGIPHSLQATNDSVNGSEFMLIFDNGVFAPEMTFLVNWLAHTPKEAIAKNFGTDLAAWNDLPSRLLYIFPSDPPTSSEAPPDPFGQMPDPLVYHLSQVPATPVSGGTIKIVDSSTFTVAKTIAAAVVEVVPGGMRELHWHPNADEWDFFLEGTARMTAYVGTGNARTWDFEGGDVGYVPKAWGHYVENIGNTTLKYLEIFKSDKYEDVSLQQWLAYTPSAVVQGNTGLSPETIAAFNGTKATVVAPDPKLS